VILPGGLIFGRVSVLKECGPSRNKLSASSSSSSHAVADISVGETVVWPGPFVGARPVSSLRDLGRRSGSERVPDLSDWDVLPIPELIWPPVTKSIFSWRRVPRRSSGCTGRDRDRVPPNRSGRSTAGTIPFKSTRRTGSWCAPGAQGQFQEPHQVRIDHEGNVWLVDSGLHVVRNTHWRKAAAHPRNKGKPGEDSTHFNRPTTCRDVSR